MTSRKRGHPTQGLPAPADELASDMTKKRSAIWPNLQTLRDRAGLTQQQLADRAKVRRETVSRLESGKKVRTSTGTVDAIARALGVRVADLYTEAPSVTETPIEPLLQRFLVSPWGQAIAPTPDELQWLRSAPSAFWVGLDPSDETFALLVQAYRKSGRKNP